MKGLKSVEFVFGLVSLVYVYNECIWSTGIGGGYVNVRRVEEGGNVDGLENFQPEFLIDITKYCGRLPPKKVDRR